MVEWIQCRQNDTIILTSTTTLTTSHYVSKALNIPGMVFYSLKMILASECSSDVASEVYHKLQHSTIETPMECVLNDSSMHHMTHTINKSIFPLLTLFKHRTFCQRFSRKQTKRFMDTTNESVFTLNQMNRQKKSLNCHIIFALEVWFLHLTSPRIYFLCRTSKKNETLGKPPMNIQKFSLVSNLREKKN